MRVLHLVKTNVGGTNVLIQMRELVRLGVEVHVTLPEDAGLAPQYRENGIKVHILDSAISVTQPLSNPKRFERLRSLVDQIQPDLIHSHFVQTTLTMRLALRSYSIPRLFYVHGMLHLEHAFFLQLDLRSSTDDDYWMGVCKPISAKYVALGIPAHRVFLAYPAQDIVEDVTMYRGYLRKLLGFTPDDLLVGMVAYMYPPKRYLGQLQGLKRHEDLIDALALCRAKGLPVHGIFVGGAYLNAQGYEQKVRKYGERKLGDKAIFLGARNDVMQLYPDFNVAVNASITEGFSGVRESLMMAIPTIATNVGGHPDAVIPDETGWLVPPRNPQALAVAIEEVLQNPQHARRLAQNGRALVQRLTDSRIVAQEVLNAYHAMLSEY